MEVSTKIMYTTGLSYQQRLPFKQWGDRYIPESLLTLVFLSRTKSELLARTDKKLRKICANKILNSCRYFRYAMKNWYFTMPQFDAGFKLLSLMMDGEKLTNYETLRVPQRVWGCIKNQHPTMFSLKSDWWLKIWAIGMTLNQEVILRVFFSVFQETHFCVKKELVFSTQCQHLSFNFKMPYKLNHYLKI